MDSIFSTYSTGENRVTASFLAVLRSLSLERIQRLLAKLLEEDEFELARFENQPSKGGTGVPDAVIHASFRLLIETKIKRGAIENAKQIERHLKRLDKANEASLKLLVITPDDSCPKIIESMSDERIAWTSFSVLDQAIDDILGDKEEVTSEREAFLLRELQKMLTAEGLLASENDVLVVAARNAWPEYNRISAYVCQANRPFQPVVRLGFYSKNNVHDLVPKILETHEDVEMVSGQYPGALGKLVDRLIRERRREEGNRHKVLLLSSPDSSNTLRLSHPIPNNKTSKTGKPTAFTMGHCYVASQKLKVAKTTLDLA